MKIKTTLTRKQQSGLRNGAKWTVSSVDGRYLGEIESAYNCRWTFNEWGKCVWDAPRIEEYRVEAVQEGFESLACATFKARDYGSAAAALAAAKAWVAGGCPWIE